MSSTTINEDLRSIKTKKALYAAMFSLLKKYRFKKITIRAICEEALISRAAFYAHFIDKYDLLKHGMEELWNKDLVSNHTYDQIEQVINNHIQENISILKNLVEDADDETFGVLFDFILSTLSLAGDKKDNEESIPKNIVVSNFCAGGILSYFLWQVKNKFPSEVPPMNKYLYQIIRELQDWQSN